MERKRNSPSATGSICNFVMEMPKIRMAEESALGRERERERERKRVLGERDTRIEGEGSSGGTKGALTNYDDGEFASGRDGQNPVIWEGRRD